MTWRKALNDSEPFLFPLNSHSIAILFGFGLLLSLLFVWICFWQLFLGLRSVFFCPLSNTSNELSDFSFVYASCRTVDKTFVSRLLWIGFGVMVGSDFRYRLLLCELVRNSACLKKGKRLSEQSERINRCDSTATRKACATHTSSLCCPSLRSGRSAAGAGERGGFSPHPATNGGTRISASFGPSQRSAPLRCAALALLRSNAPHRSPSLRAAHRLHRFTGRLLPAILLRRCLPSRNTCKLYVAHGNMVIDHIIKATSLPCSGLLCRTRRQRFRTGGSGSDAGIACAIRMVPPSLCMLQTLGVLPGAARAL